LPFGSILVYSIRLYRLTLARTSIDKYSQTLFDIYAFVLYVLYEYYWVTLVISYRLGSSWSLVIFWRCSCRS